MRGKHKIQLADFNRMAILTSSNALFLSRGIEGTTMEDIAYSVGFSKTTLYTYFENKQHILDHLIFEAITHFHQKIIQIASQQSSFREFFLQLCHALLTLYDSESAYFPGVTGNIIGSEKKTDNSKIVVNIRITAEKINHLIATRFTAAVEKKEIELNAPVADIMMLFWLCLSGLVEKSSPKETCFLQHLDKDRTLFLNFAFEALLSIIEKESNK